MLITKCEVQRFLSMQDKIIEKVREVAPFCETWIPSEIQRVGRSYIGGDYVSVYGPDDEVRAVPTELLGKTLEELQAIEFEKQQKKLQRKAALKRSREERDRREWERLKKKFGDGSGPNESNHEEK